MRISLQCTAIMLAPAARNRDEVWDSRSSDGNQRNVGRPPERLDDAAAYGQIRYEVPIHDVEMNEIGPPATTD